MLVEDIIKRDSLEPTSSGAAETLHPDSVTPEQLSHKGNVKVLQFFLGGTLVGELKLHYDDWSANLGDYDEVRLTDAPSVVDPGPVEESTIT